MTPDYAGSGLTNPPPKPVPAVCELCASPYSGGHSRGCRLYVKPIPKALIVARETVPDAAAFDGTYPVVATTAGRKDSPLPGSTEGF